MREQLEWYLEAIRPLTTSQAVLVADADADRLAALTRSLRDFMRTAGPTVDPLATAKATAKFQAAQLTRQFKSLGITPRIIDRKLPARIEAFAAGNATLIESLATEASDRIAKLVAAEFQKGTRHEDIATLLRDSLDVAENRAKTIARDQVGSLYGQVNADRQKEAGIKGFIWRTVGDNRVRDDHEARNGEAYLYSDPPEGELPGEPILCRCFAEPDISTIGDD
jgi:SPP1 gp7 family putative phage head morphogenesis protein